MKSLKFLVLNTDYSECIIVLAFCPISVAGEAALRGMDEGTNGAFPRRAGLLSQ